MLPEILKLIEDIQSLNAQEKHARLVALQDYLHNLLIDEGGNPNMFFAKQMLLISNHRPLKKKQHFTLVCEISMIFQKNLISGI